MTMRKVSAQVEYVTQHGTVPNEAIQTPVTVGYPYTEDSLPELTADGYTFCGWYSTSTFDEGTLVNAGDTVPQNPILYAKWERITVASSLTSLANEIRTLSGATDPLGLGEMATHVAEANGEIVTQTALLDEILAMLPKFFLAVGTPLNDVSWADIHEISQSGQASNYFSIGDAKEIIINGTVGKTTFSNLSIWAFIIGFNHNSEIEGTNTIHFQLGKNAQVDGVDICLVDDNYGSKMTSEPGYFNLQHSFAGYFNTSGWEHSQMRTTLLGNNNIPTSPLAGSFMAALPADVRNVIKGTAKYTNNVGSSLDAHPEYVTATTDYLWLLAEYELLGAQKKANTAEQNFQKQYDYYKNGNSKIKYKHSDTTSAALWLLRSMNGSSSSECCVVSASGNVGSTYYFLSCGISPCFCV